MIKWENSSYNKMNEKVYYLNNNNDNVVVLRYRDIKNLISNQILFLLCDKIIVRGGIYGY